VGVVKHTELPVEQPPTLAFTVFTDAWHRATEMEIGAALWTTGAARTLTFDLVHIQISCHCNLSLIKSVIASDIDGC